MEKNETTNEERPNYYQWEYLEFTDERRQINYDSLKAILRHDTVYTDANSWIFDLVLETNNRYYGENKVQLKYRPETPPKISYDTFFELISIFIQHTNAAISDIELRGFDYAISQLETSKKEAIERHSKLSDRNKAEYKFKEQENFFKYCPKDKHLEIFGNENYYENFESCHVETSRRMFFEAEVWIRFNKTLIERLTKETAPEPPKVEAVEGKKESEIKLFHREIALLHYYTEIPLNVNNANEKAKIYGQGSGVKLMQHYNEITKGSLNITDHRFAVKYLKNVILLLHNFPKGKEKAEKDLKIAEYKKN